MRSCPIVEIKKKKKRVEIYKMYTPLNYHGIHNMHRVLFHINIYIYIHIILGHRSQKVQELMNFRPI